MTAATTFGRLFRLEGETNGFLAWGVEFPDGRVVVSQPEYKGDGKYQNMDGALADWKHRYSRIVWADEEA